jgi:hypothetical protein
LGIATSLATLPTLTIAPLVLSFSPVLHTISPPLFQKDREEERTYETSLSSCLINCLISALSQSHTPLRFNPKTLSKFPTSTSPVGAGWPAIPAALKQKSIRPNLATVLETAASTASSELQSQPMVRTWAEGLILEMLETAEVRCEVAMSMRAMLTMDAATRLWATAKPIPEPAPRRC